MGTFKNKKELSKALVDSILADLSEAVESHGTANVLLSGGSTPGPIYQLLDETCDFTEKLHIGLVDERYVPNTSDFSNEKYIRNCFSKHPKEQYRISGMVYDSNDEKQNLDAVKTAYSEFKEHTDVIVLGMGADGHTASIFPNDPESEVARTSPEKEIFSTKAPSDPTHRITCSMELIANAKSIYVLFYGAKKSEVFHNQSLALPIHEVLRRRTDVKLFYLAND